MKYLKVFELTGKYKNETDIIFKNKDVVCLIPKSQMCSYLYGRKTNWCTLNKSSFDNISKYSLLFRFLFKDGKKLRLTFKKGKDGYYDFDWVGEEGNHILGNNGYVDNLLDPFNDFKKNNNNKELELIKKIKKIPSKCQEEVLKRIKDFMGNGYDYVYQDKEYISQKEEKSRMDYEKLKSKYKTYTSLSMNTIKNPNIEIGFCYSKNNKFFRLVYWVNDKQFKEELKSVDQLDKRIESLLKEFQK